MFLPFIFFFLDFLAFVCFDKWIIFSLLAYFIAKQFTLKKAGSLKNIDFYSSIAMLLVQDFYINQRIGLSLLYIIPIVWSANKFKHFATPTTAKLLSCIFLLSVFLFQAVFIKMLVLGQNVGFYSTITKIFINLIIEYIVLLSMRGNRSFY